MKEKGESLSAALMLTNSFSLLPLSLVTIVLYSSFFHESFEGKSMPLLTEEETEIGHARPTSTM